MTSRVEEQSAFIQLLLQSSRARVQSILKSINRAQLLAICEIVLNVLNSNLKLSPYYRRRLSKNVIFFKQLADKSVKYKTKLKLIHENRDSVHLLLRATIEQLKTLINGC